MTVTLCEERGDYVIKVSDNGKVSLGSQTPGRGLVGMRERAELLGGSLRAGLRAEGGYLVSAKIPMPEVGS